MDKIQISRIDESGFYLEPVLVTQNEIDRHLNEEDEFTLGSVVIDGVQEGLHQPKWDGVSWVEGKADTELLEQAKQSKLDELDQACNIAILQGFDYTINNVSYRFSLSLSAQSNLQETGEMFKEGKITSEKWTVLNNETGQIERVELDQATFESMRDVARSVVRDNVSKLRDTLEPQVEAATTTEEVKAIAW